MTTALVETHTAVVLAVGDRVFKAKKSVRFPFVDLSSVESRRVACEREVALNRRLSPDVYLGVATLSGAGVDEPVVVMRRMPAERRLSSIVAAGLHDARDEVVKVARLIAAFHSTAPTSRRIANEAAPAVVLAKALQNIDELGEVADGVVTASELIEVRAHTTNYVQGRERLFLTRCESGCARDGHGDLLADDIFCLADGPRVLDCLEFDDRLRYGDVLGDVAFLAMDLERLSGPQIARAFLDAYAEHSGMTWPSSLEHFYIAQRSLVRAKVACLRLAQGDDSARLEARTLVALALRHLRDGRCRLVLIGGAPGTGKSTVAAGVADLMQLTLAQSDVVRHGIYGPSRNTDGYRSGRYDAPHKAAVYDEMLRRAAIALGHGESVVLDATWLDPQARELAAAVARSTSSHLVEMRCITPPDVARERVAARSAQTVMSDVTPELAERIAAEAPSWTTAQELDTSGSSDDAVFIAAQRLA